MIKLSDSQPFAEGRTRRCYVHPDNPEQCLKIVIAGAEKIKIRQKPIRARLPASLYCPNLNEWRGYRRAEKIRNPKIWQHIPRCYGFVQTDLGKALAVQLLRDANGDISSPLPSLLRHDIDDSLQRGFDEFLNFILNGVFYTTAVNNIIAVRLNNNDWRLYLAECKNRRPGLTFIPFVRRRRMQRIIARIRADYNKHVVR